MSKKEIAESLEDINKKLNVLVKKQCNKFSDSDKEEVEWRIADARRKGKGETQ